MKFLVFIVLSMCVFAQAHQHDPASVHGMLIVGENKIYLSHLPMFHNPHDYQVIFEAEFGNEAKQIYLAQKGSSSETVYTLVPESFVLPEMIANPKAFHAKIYKGHFERGGKLIADHVIVQIKKLVFAKKFKPMQPKPSEGTYILFGNEQEQFLAHEITSAPDFDQILSVQADAQLLGDGLSVRLTLPEQDNVTALPAEGSFGAIVNAQKASLKSMQNLYVEWGDLSF